VNDLGFHIFALNPWVDMTERVGAQFLREITPELTDKWQEVGEVDPLICRYACKLHARLLDGRPRVYVIHNRTYGCKVG
jgi:hypothetical protein